MVEEKKAYKGTISSVIMSIVVLGILLIPFATANHIQKVRVGDGKYEFKETMCWDIDEQEDFNNDVDIEQNCGSGALGYDHEYVSNGGDISLNEITYMDSVLEGTVDGYGMGMVEACDYGSIDISLVLIFLTLTREDVIENDVVRIDAFFGVDEMEDCEYELHLFGEGGGDRLELGIITANELVQIEITVDDIMEIYAFSEYSEFMLLFEPTEEECVIQSDTVIIFDMQMYCIEEITISSIDWLGIAMIGAGFFMMFCSILMIPTIDFGGVARRLFGRKPVTGGE